MTLSNELSSFLKSQGASLVGFADLSNIVEGDMTTGISIAVVLPKEVIRNISDGPTLDYFQMYHCVNKLLNSIVLSGEAYLTERGCKAYAQTTDRVEEYGIYRTKIPHKTVATSAGLGWIGKSALFLTKEYGSAIRLSSIITDATLDFGSPVIESICGTCMICVNACPAQAISGELWNVHKDRDEFYDPLACRKEARRLSKDRIDKDISLCGKCIEVCPYTRKYIKVDKEHKKQRSG